MTFKASCLLAPNSLMCSGDSGSWEGNASPPNLPPVYELAGITLNYSIRGLLFPLSGTRRHLLCLHTLVCLPGQTQSQRCSVLCGVNGNCGRQVTNLNGTRIFGVVQQSDGAAVFPLKIPDAATHESAQHLLGESLLCV